MNERYKQASIIIVGIIILISMILSFGGRDRITAIESGLGSLLLPVQKFLSSVGNFIDEKTDGQYAAQVDQAQTFLKDQLGGAADTAQ